MRRSQLALGAFWSAGLNVTGGPLYASAQRVGDARADRDTADRLAAALAVRVTDCSHLRNGEILRSDAHLCHPIEHAPT